MKRIVRWALTVVVIVLITAPLSVVTTIILFPFWSWFESATRIESVGHSGPADWCYAVIFLLTTGGAMLLVWMVYRSRRSDADGIPPE